MHKYHLLTISVAFLLITNAQAQDVDSAQVNSPASQTDSTTAADQSPADATEGKSQYQRIEEVKDPNGNIVGQEVHTFTLDPSTGKYNETVEQRAAN